MLTMLTLLTLLTLLTSLTLLFQGIKELELSGEPKTTVQKLLSNEGEEVALGATLIVLVTGFLTGAAAAAVTGDASLTWDSTLAHLTLVPAVLTVLGLVALLHGWAPVLLAPVGWAMVGLVVFAGTFAALLDVPQAVVDL